MTQKHTHHDQTHMIQEHKHEHADHAHSYDGQLSFWERFYTYPSAVLVPFFVEYFLAFVLPFAVLTVSVTGLSLALVCPSAISARDETSLVWTRIAVVCGSAFVFQWLCVLVYTLLQQNETLMQRYNICHNTGKRIEMESRYFLPKDTTTEPLSADQCWLNALQNHSVYCVVSVAAFVFLMERDCWLVEHPLQHLFSAVTGTGSDTLAFVWSLVHMARDLLLLELFDGVVYYLVHRYLLHGPLWRYHVDHHVTKATLVMGGLYGHWINVIAEHALPLAGGAVFANALCHATGFVGTAACFSWLSIWCKILYTFLGNVHDHSGFEFPGGGAFFGDGSSSIHWLHHLQHSREFGGGLGLDYLLNTQARTKVQVRAALKLKKPQTR
jgi:hypothetical protein